MSIPWQRYADEHVGALDTMTAAFLFAALLLGSEIRLPDTHQPDAAGPTIALAALSCGALLWRRTHPRTVVTATALGAAGAGALGHLLTPLLPAPVMLALYRPTVGHRGSAAPEGRPRHAPGARSGARTTHRADGRVHVHGPDRPGEYGGHVPAADARGGPDGVPHRAGGADQRHQTRRGPGSTRTPPSRRRPADGHRHRRRHLTVAAAPAPGHGFGLMGTRERARSVGGALQAGHRLEGATRSPPACPCIPSLPDAKNFQAQRARSMRRKERTP